MKARWGRCSPTDVGSTGLLLVAGSAEGVVLAPEPVAGRAHDVGRGRFHARLFPWHRETVSGALDGGCTLPLWLMGGCAPPHTPALISVTRVRLGMTHPDTLRVDTRPRAALLSQRNVARPGTACGLGASVGRTRTSPFASTVTPRFCGQPSILQELSEPPACASSLPIHSDSLLCASDLRPTPHYLQRDSFFLF